MSVMIPVSWGEQFDRITIPKIKFRRIGDSAKLANMNGKLPELNATAEQCGKLDGEAGVLIDQLRGVNLQLWDIEVKSGYGVPRNARRGIDDDVRRASLKIRERLPTSFSSSRPRRAMDSPLSAVSCLALAQHSPPSPQCRSMVGFRVATGGRWRACCVLHLIFRSTKEGIRGRTCLRANPLAETGSTLWEKMRSKRLARTPQSASSGSLLPANLGADRYRRYRSSSESTLRT